jgi:hypothetical protein
MTHDEKAEEIVRLIHNLERNLGVSISGYYATDNESGDIIL